MSSFSLLIRAAALLLFATSFAAPAQGAFHLWNIREVYSNSSGTLQFIELFSPVGNQQFVAGQQISVTNLAGTLTNTFTCPINAPGDSTNCALLFGTASLQAFGGPAPDFIIPNNFLFTDGGTINYFGLGSGPYTALPLDGVLSRDWVSGTNQINSPQNFSNQTGFVVVPEPGLAFFAGASLLGFFRWRCGR